MSGKGTSGNRSTDTAARKRGPIELDDVASENAGQVAPDLGAAAAKASVHEAIGTLIGDDAERQRGTANKEATGISPDKTRKPPNR